MKSFIFIFFWLNSHIRSLEFVPLIQNAPEIVDNSLFEGDMAGVKLLNQNNTKGLAMLESSSREYWTNGIVPFTIDKYYNETEKKVIQEGMDLIQNRTCVRFTKRTNESKWIGILSWTQPSGCWSHVGRDKRLGEQIVSLQNRQPKYCINKITVAHELMHALGFYHEQSHPDRDNYVTINWENIQLGGESNFEKYDTKTSTTLGLPYDYYSIMHYGAKSFSKNGLPTIVPKQSGVVLLDSIQKSDLSDMDIRAIRKLYNCDSKENSTI